MIIGMGLCFGGIAQFTAGIFENKKGHTFSGSAFVSYGAFWISFVIILVGPNIFGCEAADNKALGVFLLFWGIFTGFVFVGTLIHGHITLKLILFTLALTFLFLSIGEFAKSHVVTTIGELRNWSLLWSSFCIYGMCRNY